jgi:hypothetical protein
MSEHISKGRGRDPRFAIGMITDWRGQPYELIEIRPHTRRDGSQSWVLL